MAKKPAKPNKATAKIVSEKAKPAPVKKESQPHTRAVRPSRGRVTIAAVLFIIILGLAGLSFIAGSVGEGSIFASNTDIKLLKKFIDPSRPHQAVVAREGDTEIDVIPPTHTQSAEIFIHEAMPRLEGKASQLSEADAHKLSALEAEVQNLRQVIEAQQQMLRMVIQTGVTDRTALGARLQEVENKIIEKIDPDAPSVYYLKAALFGANLRQDVLFFFNGWRQGLLQGQDVQYWYEDAAGLGYTAAAQTAFEFIQSLNTFGSVTEGILQQAARSLLAEVPNIKAPKEEALAPQEVEPSKVAGSQTLWQKVKHYFGEHLGRFITFRKLEGGEVSQAEFLNAQTQEDVLKALLEGDMAFFWGSVFSPNFTISAHEGANTAFVRFQALAKAHIEQQTALSELYRQISKYPAYIKGE